MNVFGTLRGKIVLFNIIIASIFLIILFNDSKKLNVIDVLLITILPLISYVLIKRYEELR